MHRHHRRHRSTPATINKDSETDTGTSINRRGWPLVYSKPVLAATTMHTHILTICLGSNGQQHPISLINGNPSNRKARLRYLVALEHTSPLRHTTAHILENKNASSYIDHVKKK